MVTQVEWKRVMLRRMGWILLLVGILVGYPVRGAEPAAKITFRLPSGVSVVSAARAKQLFVRVKEERDIAYRYAVDGCYARTHLMGRRLSEEGVVVGKIWAFDDRAMLDKKKPSRIQVRTPYHPRGVVSWKYHVAPIVGVRDGTGKVRTQVLDPSMFEEPVPVVQWMKRMVDLKIRFIPRIDLTPWGQAPKRGDGTRYPGQGYWPGEDPGPNLDSVARLTMQRYLPLQGSGRILVTARGAPVAMSIPEGEEPQRER